MTRAVPTERELIALEPDAWPDDAEAEELVGDWRMYQRRRGHRASTDDVLTAWMAARLGEGIKAGSREGVRGSSRYLDLGCGVGAVLLHTAYALRPAFSLGIEAQAVSAKMAERSVSELPPDAPEIRIERGDFRDLDPRRHGTFELITGSPPYFPLGTGVLSDDAQRRACRFELRGGIEAYCDAAARMLSEGGRFAVVFPTEGDARATKAIAASGLHLIARADVLMRQDRKKPFLTVYGAARTDEEPWTTSFAIRDARGEITDEYRAARREIGLRTT